MCEPLQVTGGSGFVGSHLVDQLMRDGHEVSAAQCLNSLHPRHLGHPTSLRLCAV